MDLGEGQHLLLSGQTVETLGANHFQFDHRFTASSASVDTAEPGSEERSDAGTVILNGGGTGVSLTTGDDGQFVFSLAGTVYNPDGEPSDRFVIAHQPQVTNYGNALRGFRHGIDKIDLSQVGVMSFEELTIVKHNRGTINGLSQVHGVEVSTPVLRGAEQPVQLLYLDALEVAQLDANDFIFATAHRPLESGQPASAPMQSLRSALAMPSQPEMSEPTSNGPGLFDQKAMESEIAARLDALKERLQPTLFESTNRGHSLFDQTMMESETAARLEAVKERLWQAPVNHPLSSQRSLEERLAEPQAGKLQQAGPFAARDDGEIRLPATVASHEQTAIQTDSQVPLWVQESLARAEQRHAEILAMHSARSNTAQSPTWDSSSDQLVQAMAAFAPPPSALPSFEMQHAQLVQPMLAANWQ